MAVISIADAARLCGKDRRTIERHLKSGVLSYTVEPSGKRVIDTSELMRVYGPLTHNASPTDDGQSNVAQQQPAVDDGEKAALRSHIFTLERQVDELREEKRELRAQVGGLLEYRRAAAPVYAAAPEETSATSAASTGAPTPAAGTTAANPTNSDKASRLDFIYLFVGIASAFMAAVLLWVDGYRPWFMV